mgnify:FL=1
MSYDLSLRRARIISWADRVLLPDVSFCGANFQLSATIVLEYIAGALNRFGLRRRHRTCSRSTGLAHFPVVLTVSLHDARIGPSHEKTPVLGYLTLK